MAALVDRLLGASGAAAPQIAAARALYDAAVSELAQGRALGAGGDATSALDRYAAAAGYLKEALGALVP